MATFGRCGPSSGDRTRLIGPAQLATLFAECRFFVIHRCTLTKRIGNIAILVGQVTKNCYLVTKLYTMKKHTALLLALMLPALLWAQHPNPETDATATQSQDVLSFTRPAPTNVAGYDYPRIDAENRVYFRTYAPDASRMAVDLCGKKYPMQKDGQGAAQAGHRGRLLLLRRHAPRVAYLATLFPRVCGASI